MLKCCCSPKTFFGILHAPNCVYKFTKFMQIKPYSSCYHLFSYFGSNASTAKSASHGTQTKKWYALLTLSYLNNGNTEPYAYFCLLYIFHSGSIANITVSMHTLFTHQYCRSILDSNFVWWKISKNNAVTTWTTYIFIFLVWLLMNQCSSTIDVY
jgi:hypothetical protein